MKLGSANNVSVVSVAESILKVDHHKVKLSWIPDTRVEKYIPCFQVYGVCFDNEGRVLIIRNGVNGQWSLPGGKPERGESVSEVLIREMKEEARVTIKGIQPLGVQRVYFKDNPNKIEGDRFYQYRFFCMLDGILERGADPDTGKMYERRFVFINDVGDYIKWGKIGEEIFKAAVRAFGRR